MKTQPITFAFAAELFTHGSWGARDIAGGAHACTMTFHEGEHAGSAWIEWNIPAIDDSEEIGLTFAMGADGKRVLTEYDGVMALPPVCVLILRDLGITVPAGEGMDEEIAEAKTLEGEEIPRRTHPLAAERYLLVHARDKAALSLAGAATKSDARAAKTEHELAAAALAVFDREHGAELAALADTHPTIAEARRLLGLFECCGVPVEMGHMNDCPQNPAKQPPATQSKPVTVTLTEAHARALIAYTCAALDDREIWLDKGEAEDPEAERADLAEAQEALQAFATQVEVQTDPSLLATHPATHSPANETARAANTLRGILGA